DQIRRQPLHQLSVRQPRRGHLRSSLRVHSRSLAQPSPRLRLWHSRLHRQTSGQGGDRGVLPRIFQTGRSRRTCRRARLDRNIVPGRSEAVAGAISGEVIGLNLRELLSVPYLLEAEAVESEPGKWLLRFAYPELPGCTAEGFVVEDV